MSMRKDLPRSGERSTTRPRGRGVGATRLAFSLLLIFIGVVTLLEGIGAIGFTFGDLMANFWPLVLIGLGALIWYESTRPHVSGPAMVADGIVYDSIFGDLKLTQPGWQLRDVRASTIIGDIKIDLSKATIPDGETIVDVRAIIGDVDIWAPPDLPVALDAQCTFVTVNYFGAKNDVILRRTVETPPAYEVAPRRVRVRAEMVFGDLNLIRARQAA